MQIRINLARSSKRGLRLAGTILLALVTPLLEKNPLKTAIFSRCYVPLVLSMGRVIVLLFALCMMEQVRRAGVAGWPESTLCIAIVLALPLLNALDRVGARETIELTKTVFERLGRGATRGIANVYSREPSKLDDHRVDGALEQAA